ncbi:MAG: aminotransferase class V-fold PLP-dependent enzyme [Verrucomicrobiota bacterium]
MTLQELHSNEAFRRQEFPVASHKIFLAHAGVCPLPARVEQAVRNYASGCTLGDQEAVWPSAQLTRFRERAARLIQAQPEEIAFVGPTSLGLSYVAGGLSFRRNDNVLVYFDDYPSNVYPWMALADRGVEVRLLNIRTLGRVRPIDVLGQVDEATRLVALASCHFLSGYRLDLNEIGAALRSRGIWFCVDGIQTVGAFPTSVQHVDFLAADAHKWMLGPCGAGILYVRKQLQDQLQPIVFGWNNVRCPQFVAQEELVFRSGAQRYEVGTHNLLGLAGLGAALELIEEVGVEQIAAELLRKRRWLIPALESKGFQVLESGATDLNGSGIVTCFKPGADLPALHQKLAEAGVIVSLRADRSGQQYLRLSPHFYNTDAELVRVLELL